MYTASLKKDSEKIEKGSSCVLGISVGQPYHENGKLKATLEFLKKNEVTNYIFLISDTLQKYTFSFKASSEDNIISPENMISISLDAGKKWEKRNKDTIKILGITKRCEFIHWNDLIESENFSKFNLLVKSMLNKKNENYDPVFNEKVNSSAEEYYKRQIKKNDKIGKNVNKYIKDISKKYIIEECVGLLCLSEKKHDFFAYPGRIMPAFEHLKSKLIEKKILKFLNISIRPIRKSYDHEKKSPKVGFFEVSKQKKEEEFTSLIETNKNLAGVLAKLVNSSQKEKSYCPIPCTIL